MNTQRSLQKMTKTTIIEKKNLDNLIRTQEKLTYKY